MTRIRITEYLGIDPSARRWHCEVCDHGIGPAHDDYKRGLLVYDRDPREVHPARLGAEHDLAPDPRWCRILEYYCPGCATQVETEYLPPGHPPTRDIEIDVDALLAREAAR